MLSEMVCGNLSNYKDAVVHGNKAEMQNAPIKEENRCGTRFFPVRLFVDMRTENDNILPHMHNAVEILHILEGSVSLKINGQSFQVREGDIVMINSLDNHEMTGTNAVYQVFQAEPDMLGEFGIDMRRYLPRLDCNKVISAEEAADSNIAGSFQNIFEQAREDGEVSRIFLISLVMQLFSNIIRYVEKKEARAEEAAASHNNQKSNERMELIITFIHQNYDRDINIDDVCDHVYLTKTYFCRFFKQMMGKTFLEYLNYYRCTQVENLMKSTDLPITDIASRVGFKSLSYFNKTYKKLRGMTPSESRRMLSA